LTKYTFFFNVMSEPGFGDTTTLGMMATGLVILAAWVFYELRQEQLLVHVACWATATSFLPTLSWPLARAA
jgi:hypothetical protein